MLKYQSVDFDFGLNEKVAVITGGAAGIGAAVAEFFVKKGVKVVLFDLSSSVEAVADQLGGDTLGIKVDITDKSNVEAALDQVMKHFGRIDILINSAGIALLDKALDVTQKDWDKTIAVNLTASFFVAQAAAARMKPQGEGCVVNIASQAGMIALDKHVAYAASKGGIIAMTKVLAYEWAEFGVRVNSVSPTVVLTELGRNVWEGPHGEAMKKSIPAGRFAETDEIAGCIAFLCSAAAGMVTGENLVVDGGYTIK